MIVLIMLFLWWTSPQPIAGDTQTIIVSGGTLRSIAVADDGRSGTIEMDAPRECAVITWSARTTSGNTIRTSRAWRDGCYKAYLPL